jgi:hypothetical protein
MEAVSQITKACTNCSPYNYTSEEYEGIVTESAFKGRLKTVKYDNPHGIVDINVFLDSLENMILDRIKQQLEEYDLKVNFVLCVIYVQVTFDGTAGESTPYYISSGNNRILPLTDLDELYKRVSSKLVAQLSECQLKGSNFTLERIEHLELKINIVH